MAIDVMDAEIEEFLRGERLYGEDLNPEEIARWFEDEKEGYADLGARDAGYEYVYHAINAHHGFRHIDDGRIFQNALGYGSAYGDEFCPISDRVCRLTIVEPSRAFWRNDVCGIPAEFIEPASSGVLPFAGDTFDLITCLDVLHHVPNVSQVLQELGRCLEPGGILLLREPIISMGDWRRNREGLTKHERGIPLAIFRRIISDAGLVARSEVFWLFPLVRISGQALNAPPYASRIPTKIDAFLSRLFSWNYRYHATKWFEKIRPTCVYYVLSK